MVYEATDQNFQDLIQADYAAVDFYGTYCGPCKLLEPVFNAMSNDLPLVRFIKVNIDHCPEVKERFHIRAVPTLKYFRSGTLFYEGREHGSREALNREIAKLLY